ncbi:MAG: hypothetical protein Q8M40_03935 [Legionella sp.]|nr:hypothetical protein [Legionella sp.]
MLKKPVLPTKDSIMDAMNVAETSEEAAHYLVCRFEKILTDAKMLMQSQEIVKAVEEFARYVNFKFKTMSQPWAGELPEKDGYKNMHQNIANEAATELQGSNIKFDFAINNDNSAFLRGYSSENGALDAKAVIQADQLFNAWLAENNLASKDSILHSINENGKPMRDEHGNLKTVNATEFNSLLMDDTKGFEHYLEKKGINVEIAQQQYPSASQDKKQRDAVKEVLSPTVSEDQKSDFDAPTTQTRI